MRNWFRSLMSAPRGYSADGRRLGLALATAMEKQRRDAANSVEDYLRTQGSKERTNV